MGLIWSAPTEPTPEHIETFLPSVQIPREITVLSRGDAWDALIEAEAGDAYRASCERCSMNKAARRLMDYSAREPPADAQYNVLVLAEGMPAWLKRGLPMYIQIACLASSADGGMPHTRHGNLVCFPQYFDLTGAAAQDTFNHEMIHVHQRTHSVVWDSLYDRVWNFKRYTGPIPDDLVGRVRINPDTYMEQFYIWREVWVPFPIFARPEQPMLGAIKIAWYNVRTGSWQTFAPPEFGDDFGHLSEAQAEHPHELAAYWLSTPAPVHTPMPHARLRMEEAIQTLHGK